MALTALLALLWLLIHGYQGLTGDAQIYALQAMARIEPQLTTDLYLQNTSQDQFTVFSPLYAFCIREMGLEQAARSLTIIFTIWLYAAAWNLSRAFADRITAFLVVAFLMTITGDYGASGVFRLFENYLTARLPAEAMIITALACHFRGARRTGWLLAAGAMLVHPLIALPGLLLLITWSLPLGIAAAAAIIGIAVVLAISTAAATIPAVARAIMVIDADWLAVVRERSQFLLLPLWSIRDWSVNAQPFIALLLATSIIQNVSARKLCASVALVGFVGLALALVGGLVPPIALLLQGQAWRWVWLVIFFAAFLAPQAILKAWGEDSCGRLCAMLLMLSWAISSIGGTACAALALCVWLARNRINVHIGGLGSWLVYLLGAGMVAWVLTRFWRIVISTHTNDGNPLFTSLHSIFNLEIFTILVAGLACWTISKSRQARQPMLRQPMLWLAGLSIAVIVLWPLAFHQTRILNSAAQVQEFSDWSQLIPPQSTVLVAPARDVGAFVWFTLMRPNYLSLDQSAGAIFSRSTALEVERRSRVLLPLMDPDWKILTRNRAIRMGEPTPDVNRPLTTAALIKVCSDPLLGFVISPETVGFNPVGHHQAGGWKDWNLYDCRNVRQFSAPT